jgi:hypothetical protein
MLFTDTVLTQTLTLMPNCKLLNVGNYKHEGNVLEIGTLKASISQTCPPGIRASDKQASKAIVNFQLNNLVLTVSPGGVCPADDALVIIMQKKARSLY